MLRGAILDVDGTLIDSNGAHAEAFSLAFAEQGLDLPVARVRRLIGMGADKLLPALGVEARSRMGVAIARRKREIFEERYLRSLHPFRGARDLLDHMKSCGLARVVASSAKADELRGLLQQAGIEDAIDEASSSSDAKASKPDPDIVEAAIARAGCPREALVMLGDTPYDVEAALRAGVRIVTLRCGGWTDKDLAGAIAIYDDPADLLAHYEGSIFA